MSEATEGPSLPERLLPLLRQMVFQLDAMAGVSHKVKRGPGAHRSGDIAGTLRVKVQSGVSLRGGLIRKGMIYSPAHGHTAFTVPLFDEFMRRTMPAWKLAAR